MKQFTCAGCNLTFNTSSTPEDYKIEYERMYQEDYTEADTCSLCDLCYEILQEHQMGNTSRQIRQY